jgi:uncharacterized membrane protein
MIIVYHIVAIMCLLAGENVLAIISLISAIFWLRVYKKYKNYDNMLKAAQLENQ